MDRRTTEEKVETLIKMKKNGVFQKYIEYIEFPFYKNMEPRTRIVFDFPLTILVGKNGSGKSSTLHALYGAPHWHSCSDFWFSTEVDPIIESGGKNRFFYGYLDNKNSEIKEVMKTRMKRGSKTKEDDPDYWETSKPIKKDGMINSKRNDPLKKKVVYIDFRAEVSAFDKILHFSKGEINQKKALLRKRSKYLNRLFNGDPLRFPGCDDKKKGYVVELNQECLDIIGCILGKQYISIKVAEHSIYTNSGVSIYVKTQFSSMYSEANAGSGEVAVIQLIKRIQEVEDFSLVLLDEPEVSIHPGAQEKLKGYLLNIAIKKKLQIVVSTHSPILIEEMPNSAIKLYITNQVGKFLVRSDVNYQEAFFDIEDRVMNKKLIICEDFGAQQLIVKLLKSIDKDQYFDVNYSPGGEKTLVSKVIPAITTNKQLIQKVYCVLDGDMETDYVFDEHSLTSFQRTNIKYLEECIFKAFNSTLDVYVDGGDDGIRIDQKCEAYIKYLRFYSNNIFYLPDKSIPEEILLGSEYVKKNYKEVLDKYEIVTNKNAKEIILDISMDEFGDKVHAKDIIEKLAHKWSLESNNSQNIMKDFLNKIFQNET